MEVRRYLTASGNDVVGEWLAGLKDAQARARITTRIARLEAGNFGDCKPVGEGVWELRIDWGPGYRVYYASVGSEVVLLLCGGDKRRQPADIRKAVALRKDYRRRTTET
ncbi:hypothetical protein RAS1_13820 [Phycisphaerae bacterium RAS1]|nr:hypothetical protein RAS1_13820 [Phycisphaerae bacterium RAS1]